MGVSGGGGVTDLYILSSLLKVVRDLWKHHLSEEDINVDGSGE